MEGHEQDAVMENEWGSRQQESMDDSSKTSRACHILRTNKGLMWPMGEAEEKMERGMWCKVLGAMPATFAWDLEPCQLVGDF